MAIEWLPEALKQPRGRVLNWTERTDPKGCLHTTESSGWPGYANWTVHPHATIMPKPGVGVEVRQNVPFSRASFSLRNLAGGVQTNTDYVFQFELIGTCERGGPGYFWPDADDAVLKDLYRKVIQPLSAGFRIPLKARPFQAYPASYGARGKTNKVRMPGAEFDNYSGWLGHQHVPENAHGDPGLFPWNRMMTIVTPQEETLKLDKDDQAFIARTAREAVVDVLTNQRLVRNQPLDGEKEGDPWVMTGVMSNIEKDVDIVNRRMAQIENAQVETLRLLNVILANNPPPA